MKFTITKGLLNKQFQKGGLLTFLIADTKGKSVYCNKCGNIANAIIELPYPPQGVYNIPVCKAHFEQAFPDWHGGYPVRRAFTINYLRNKQT